MKVWSESSPQTSAASTFYDFFELAYDVGRIDVEAQAARLQNFPVLLDAVTLCYVFR